MPRLRACRASGVAALLSRPCCATAAPRRTSATAAAAPAAAPAGLTRDRPEIGGAVLGVEAVRGRSTIVRASWTSPMRLLMPRNAVALRVAPPPLPTASAGVGATQPAAGANWVYSVTYGGGLVSGDAVAVAADIGAGCTTVLATQSSTKVYGPHQIVACPNPEGVTRQGLEARVGDGALLAVLPDPIVCYADAVLEQSAALELAEHGSVVAVDPFTAGQTSAQPIKALFAHATN